MARIKTQYAMSNQEYFEQLDAIVAGEQTILGGALCNKFLERLEKGIEIAYKKGYPSSTPEGINPHALGYALKNDIHLSGIAFSKEIRIFMWLEFYLAIDNDDVDALENSVIELLHLEKKWVEQF